MKTIFVFAAMLSGVVSAKEIHGPMPHERTDTPKIQGATSGRYIYLGDAPKFDGKELEITISKLNLTTRVTAHVNQGRIDTYARQLFMRWKSLNDASSDPVFSLHPLVRLSKLAEGKAKNTVAWAKIAEQYSQHVLESTGMDIYRDQRNSKNFSNNEEKDQYQNTISEAYFKYLFDTKESPGSVIDDNKKLEELLSPANSARLFHKHLGHLYTKSTDRANYLGYLTFVYPIAATVAGPFNQPKEQIVDLKTAESIEARWWSDKWNDEFGGFPFLLIEWSGVAFHGPITNFAPLDVWFLRRGYVSHGCHRMDSSDVMEFRSLMPTDLKKAASQIKVTILDYVDVVDWNKDGIEEAIDVKFYGVPTSISVPKSKSVEDAVKPFLVENQAAAFIKNNQYAKAFYDELTDSFKDIPRYQVLNKKLVRDGKHSLVPIYRFDYRPNRLIQYTEEGAKLMGYDDAFGKYPPKFFQRY